MAWRSLMGIHNRSGKQSRTTKLSFWFFYPSFRKLLLCRCVIIVKSVPFCDTIKKSDIFKYRPSKVFYLPAPGRTHLLVSLYLNINITGASGNLWPKRQNKSNSTWKDIKHILINGKVTWMTLIFSIYLKCL